MRIAGLLVYCCAALLASGCSSQDAATPPASAITASADPALEPKIVVQLGHQAPVLAVHWVDDGRHLASIARDGSIVLWNVATGTVLDHAQVPLDPALLDGARRPCGSVHSPTAPSPARWQLPFQQLRKSRQEMRARRTHITPARAGARTRLTWRRAWSARIRACSPGRRREQARIALAHVAGRPAASRSEPRRRPARRLHRADENINFADPTCVSVALSLRRHPVRNRQERRAPRVDRRTAQLLPRCRSVARWAAPGPRRRPAQRNPRARGDARPVQRERGPRLMLTAPTTRCAGSTRRATCSAAKVTTPPTTWTTQWRDFHRHVGRFRLRSTRGLHRGREPLADAANRRRRTRRTRLARAVVFPRTRTRGWRVLRIRRGPRRRWQPDLRSTADRSRLAGTRRQRLAADGAGSVCRRGHHRDRNVARPQQLAVATRTGIPPTRRSKQVLRVWLLDIAKDTAEGTATAPRRLVEIVEPRGAATTFNDERTIRSLSFEPTLAASSSPMRHRQR